MFRVQLNFAFSVRSWSFEVSVSSWYLLENEHVLNVFEGSSKIEYKAKFLTALLHINPHIAHFKNR